MNQIIGESMCMKLNQCEVFNQGSRWNIELKSILANSGKPWNPDFHKVISPSYSILHWLNSCVVFAERLTQNKSHLTVGQWSFQSIIIILAPWLSWHYHCAYTEEYLSEIAQAFVAMHSDSGQV